MDELPEAGQPVGGEEEQTPAFVLLDMDTLMWTEALQLFPGDGQDDVAENDGTKPKLTRESPTAIGGFAVGDLERAARHPRATAKGERYRGDGQAHRGARCRPQVLEQAHKPVADYVSRERATRSAPPPRG